MSNEVTDAMYGHANFMAETTDVRSVNIWGRVTDVRSSNHVESGPKGHSTIQETSSEAQVG